MNSRIDEISETIDRATSRSICDAVGERLQQSWRTAAAEPAPGSPATILLPRAFDRRNAPAGPGKPPVELAQNIRPERPGERYFTHKRVAFGCGSGDKAAC